jgi:hypothetical protein
VRRSKWDLYFQNNRNPYIDHPEYAINEFGAQQDSQAPTAPSNLLASGTTDKQQLLIVDRFH